MPERAGERGLFRVWILVLILGDEDLLGFGQTLVPGLPCLSVPVRHVFVEEADRILE